MAKKGEDFDFMAAIEAHVRWKVRLEAHIAGNGTEELSPEIVGRDDQCVLGKWIHGSGGTAYASHPGFDELRETHAQFHRNAARIIELANAGNTEQAMASLNQGEYASCSAKVKSKLARLSPELDYGE